MARKPKVDRDKRPPASKPSATSSKTKSAAAPKGYFVAASGSLVVISDRKPRSGEPERFDTFEEARQAAIDSLVAAIEEAERRLAALKRARDYDELQRGESLS